MTYILGWKKNNTVYLFADSAITREGEDLPELPGELSKFGEILIKEKGKQIDDEAFKIINVLDKSIVAYAGNVHLCYQILDDVCKRARYEKQLIHDIIKEVLEEYNNPIEVAFIFGFCLDGVTKLYAYNCAHSGRTKLIEYEDFAFAGSCLPEYIDLTKDYLIRIGNYRMNGKEVDEHFTLAMVCAFVQSLSIHKYLLKLGIGGLFTGAFVNENGAFWMEDTTYMLYSDEIKTSDKPRAINVGIRDNGVLIKSPLPSGRGLYINSVGLFNAEKDWMAKNYEPLNEKLDSFQNRFFIFLNISRPVIVVTTIEKMGESGLFKIKIIDEKELDVGLRNEFIAKLTIKGSTTAPSNFPVIFFVE